MKYPDTDGVPFDDSDVERRATEAEVGLLNSVAEAAESRAWGRDAPMQVRSVWVPVGVWNLVASKAQDESVIIPDYTRRAVSEGLIVDS